MAMNMKSVGKSLVHPNGTPLRPAAVVKPATVSKAAPAGALVDTPVKAIGPIILNGQVAHSITQERLEIIRSKEMYDFLEKSIVPLARTAEKCWQPTDWMPKSDDPEFLDKVRALRERCKNLPDEWLVVFVGDMITEEALPTYMSMINGLDGVRDETGSSDTPWARWTRTWVADENRHGDAMSRYMFLTGRVNMRAVEVTVQNLICSGMDPKTENNPYLGFTYTSFQERATKISHGNTARFALEYGCDDLAKLAGLIAADEGRHEQAYQGIIKYLFDGPDPNGAMLAFGDMMKKQITMPAHMMDDLSHGQTNKGRNLFMDFAAVAERIGSYNAFDYADIVDYLIRKWDIPSRHFTSGEAAAAQDYVVRLPDRMRKLAERAQARQKKGDIANFAWVFNRPVQLH